MFEHVVPIPTDKRLKNVRAWLIDNVGQAEDAWTITVDLEVIEFYKGNTFLKDKADLNDRFFVIGFKNEEDKVKFILTFL